MRVIVFSGKGGSGVSTIAAATAAALAAAGKRTLAFGIAKGLGRAFDVPLGLAVSRVLPNLDAAEGTSGYGGPDEFRDWLESLLDFRGMDVELAEDLAGLPGVNHLARLLELERLASSGGYDVLVLDAAEVGQFLDLPAALDAAARWLERLFAPRQQTLFETFGRALVADYASAGDEVFESGRALLSRLADFRDLLADPAVSTVRIVVRPERGALADVEEALAVLSLFSCRVDAVIVNQVLPPEVTDPFFARMRAAQQAFDEGLVRLELPQALLTLALAPEPPHGAEALRALGQTLYAAAAPDAILAETPGHTVEREASQYILNVVLPFARRESLRLEEMDEGIEVQLNGRRCVITLPEDVEYAAASSWAYEDGVLRVVLER